MDLIRIAADVLNKLFTYEFPKDQSFVFIPNMHVSKTSMFHRIEKTTIVDVFLNYFELKTMYLDT